MGKVEVVRAPVEMRGRCKAGTRALFGEQREQAMLGLIQPLNDRLPTDLARILVQVWCVGHPVDLH
jgi:hypothetical protein